MQTETLEYALRNRRSVRAFTTKSLSKAEVLELAWAAQGITSDDFMRTAPSANGLHPLKISISTGPSRDLQSSVWRYDFSLSDLTLVIDKDVRKDLADSAIGDQNWIQSSPCIMTFFADIDAVNYAFSTQPPLGRRGERYVYVEAGCAAQNAMLKATALGIGCTLVAGFDDRETSRHLRLESGMRPLLHLCFGHKDRVAKTLDPS